MGARACCGHGLMVMNWTPDKATLDSHVSSLSKPRMPLFYLCFFFALSHRHLHRRRNPTSRAVDWSHRVLLPGEKTASFAPSMTWMLKTVTRVSVALTAEPPNSK